MSRLIEALKKAEEAKRRAAQADTGGLSLELEVRDEPADKIAEDPDQPDTDLQPEPNLTLEPTYTAGSQTTSAEAPAEREVREPQPAPSGRAADGKKDASAGQMRRRLTDHRSQDNAYSLKTRRGKTRLVAVALVAILLLAALAGYFYWRLVGTAENPYANLNTNNQNRGFLEASASGEETPTNVATGESDTVVDPGTAEAAAEPAPDSPTRTTIGAPQEAETPAEDEAIASVNNLIASSQSASSSAQDSAAVKAAVDAPVFAIERSGPVAGSAESLDFIQANLQEGEWQAARSEIDALLEQRPRHVRALHFLAQLEMATGNSAAAERAYARILEINPRNAAAQAGLVTAARSEDALDYEANLTNLSSQYPQAAFLPYLLGNHFAAQARWSEARGAYNRAVEIAANSGTAIQAEYLYNLAVALEHLQRPEQALAQYRRALGVSQTGGGIAPDSIRTRIAHLENALQP